MKPSLVACARHLIEEYRRFLKTSYRLLDDNPRDGLGEDRGFLTYCY